MKRLLLVCTLLLTVLGLSAASLRFNPNDYKENSLTMPDGTVVKFKAYEGIYYVENVEDSTYQTLNIYVPLQKCSGRVPILLRNNVGAYMSAKAKGPSATDASGRALQEGYVVCIPGTRGSNAVVQKNGKQVYTGIAPNGLLDLKAVVRYLRANADVLEGDTELIFSDGTSAGGAMSSLLGATGNAKVYEPYLQKMGAAQARDDIFASICYCPITDLDHSDMLYEWLYSRTNDGVRQLNSEQKKISEELAALAPAYINSLGLRKADGTAITADNYLDYLKTFLLASAHRALQEGVQMPDTIGLVFYNERPGGMPQAAAPQGGNARPQQMGGRGGMGGGRQSDFVTDLDLDKYLSFVASSTRLKTPPAFDAMGVAGGQASAENRLFGSIDGQPANFTDFSLQHATGKTSATVDKATQQRVEMMNPMNFIGKGNSTVAPRWFIRHGAKDRDTSFLVPVNLATKLMNDGKSVDFALPWNRPHSGDYNLDDLFAWIAKQLN